MSGLRWSEQQLAQFIARNGVAGTSPRIDASKPPFQIPANEAGAFALGRLPTGTMNKTESLYDQHLWEQRHLGLILWHKFEGIKLRLADNTFLTVDFAVLPKTGVLEMREVKGHWQDDARVKIKVAAAIYPFKFVAVRKTKDGWQQEEFS